MLTFSRTLVPRFTKLLPNFSQTLDHVGAVVVISPPMIFIGTFLFHDFTLHTFSLSYQHFLQGGRRAYNYGLAVCLYLMITARMAFTYALSFTVRQQCRHRMLLAPAVHGKEQTHLAR